MANRSARVLYLDASAIVKLVVRESETDALMGYVSETELITSEIATIEVPRAAHLKTGAEMVMGHAEELLLRFYIVALDDALLKSAARTRPPELRTLDAIHLASAIRIRDHIDAVVAYDHRLERAAKHSGLRVAAPQ